jgi:alpha-1,2-mannosyltransferase
MHLLLSSRSVCWFWLKTHPFTALGVIALLIVAISFCRRQDSEWEQVYVTAAGHLWQGTDVYRVQDGYLYPPFMALSALPFLLVPAPLSRPLWFGINVFALLALVCWSWRLAGGGRLEGSAGTKRAERLAAVLGFLCGISYIENCLAHQQTDLVIAAVLSGGCLLLQCGRALSAATLFGLASACKCTPLLWAPYLFWRGRLLSGVWVVVVAVGVNLLPDLVSSSGHGQLLSQQHASRYLLPMTASKHYIGTWGSDPVYNQSLTGLGQRWCLTAWSWTANDCTIQPISPRLQPHSLRICVYGVELTLLGMVLWICRQPFRKLNKRSDASLQALECGIVLMLMLLLSPMSSKAHFGTLIVPGFCLARAAVSTRGWLLKALLAASVILGLLCNKDPLGERLYTLSLWYGVVTWQTLLLLAGCVLVYRQQRLGTPALLPCPALANSSSSLAA